MAKCTGLIMRKGMINHGSSSQTLDGELPREIPQIGLVPYPARKPL